MRDPNFPSNWSASLALNPKYKEARPSYTPSNARQASANPSIAKSHKDMPECEFLASSARSMAMLRNLPSSAIIVLLSPVIVPPGGMTSRSRDDPVDPFERLGKAMSEYHAKIRHVPYIPTVGMTQTHLAWIRQAAAIFVVACPSAVRRHENTDAQSAFIKGVATARNSRSKPENVPCTLVEFGDIDIDEDLHSDYENVLASPSISSDAFEIVAEALFE